MVDSISLMIEVSSTGQSPSKFLIIGLRLARILEFEEDTISRNQKNVL